jgi:hypothetical protein
MGGELRLSAGLALVEVGASRFVWRCPDSEDEPVTLQRLRAEYSATSKVWAWLRSRGYRRPSPSGPTMPHRERSGRLVQVYVSEAARARLDAMAAARHVSRAAVVESLILGAATEPGHLPAVTRTK